LNFETLLSVCLHDLRIIHFIIYTTEPFSTPGFRLMMWVILSTLALQPGTSKHRGQESHTEKRLSQ